MMSDLPVDAPNCTEEAPGGNFRAVAMAPGAAMGDDVA
jgi:hypothetical protein